MKKTVITFACILVLAVACLSQRARKIMVYATGQGSAQSDGTAVGIIQAQNNADQQARNNAQSNLQNACSGNLESSVVIYDVCSGSDTITCSVNIQGLCQQ